MPSSSATSTPPAVFQPSLPTKCAGVKLPKAQCAKPNYDEEKRPKITLAHIKLAQAKCASATSARTKVKECEANKGNAKKCEAKK